MMYCKTISELGGHHWYGIDLMSYEDGKFNVLLSVENVTDSWAPICRLVHWANIINVPPKQFHEFLDAVKDNTSDEDDDPVQHSSESGFPEQSKREYITYRINEKNFVGQNRKSNIPVKLDEKVIDRICRILGCRPEDLDLPEGR